MAKCDEGYLCEVCGRAVEGIVQSDLYLRFVIGELDPEQLHTTHERHIACNPILAQFVDDADFTVELDFQGVPDAFRLEQLDADFVASRRRLVTRGWQRLRELATTQDSLAIYEYPLPEVRAKWQ